MTQSNPTATNPTEGDQPAMSTQFTFVWPDPDPEPAMPAHRRSTRTSRFVDWFTTHAEPIFIAATIVALVALAFVAGITYERIATACFEDEVKVWDGNTHSVCVPIDDLEIGGER